MTKIEAVFGGILMLAVVGAVAFTLFQKGFAGGTPIVISQPAPSDSEEIDASVFTGDVKTDVCTCYEKAFSRGTQGYSLQSVAYKSGFSSCRQNAGMAGGQAWTDGWLLGKDGKFAQRSCRLYVNGLDLD